MDLLEDILVDKDIDVLVLQEVRDEGVVNRLKERAGFSYSFWKKYEDCQEGLAILSRYEMTDLWDNWDQAVLYNSGALVAKIDYKGFDILIGDIHLDYKYAHHREEALLTVHKHLAASQADYRILAGDFNAYPESQIYRYLTGQASMAGTSGRFIDLAKSYCFYKNQALEVTLDFLNNPRWLDTPTLEIPGRFDWILLEDPYPSPSPRLVDYQLLGKTPVQGITPSDHYGVLVDLDFGGLNHD